ncbi:nucleotidyltransferase family protein [Klebsiella oxytoca]|uniref:Nucleotidyltransferase family protein n=1 Tax=Klebsiella oxytoca TaxID=571 RepID=A0A6B8MU76_KLEOX|nr:nucleotidyltransferase family protein [Klebsiella oxytoca]QGN37893.1 hypothetical protein GJ746_11535 [Klebsiella oxytoca]
MGYPKLLQKILSDDPLRMNVLYAVRRLKLNDGWVGAGFVRNAVWDNLHGYGQNPVSGDVDVVWFDRECCDQEYDSYLEKKLSQQLPGVEWSVKNQARMHLRNGDSPYHSTENALLYWPETATAIGVRLGHDDGMEIIAPYGLDDLFELRLRPTPIFEHKKLDTFKRRITDKRWLERYPGLRLFVPGQSVS